VTEITNFPRGPKPSAVLVKDTYCGWQGWISAAANAKDEDDTPIKRHFFVRSLWAWVTLESAISFFRLLATIGLGEAEAFLEILP
jgi:hypothetical protein